LSLNVGVAVCSLLQRLQLPDVRLKWPNDVYVNSRKVCGILIESVPTRPERLAIGIGLNINNSLQDAPTDIRQRATSLIDELGASSPLIEILVSLLCELHDVLRLCGHSPEVFPPLWNQLSWLTGREVQIDDVRGQTQGQVLSIDTDGALCVQTRQGPVRVVSGTVTTIR
jgi:BirA family biotin operon repressor/biotin-[acetyl-CoA-carboxylase] ligase